MKRILAFFALFCCLTSVVLAQMVNPVKWEHSTKQDGNTLVITFKAAIEEHWHLYNMNVPEGGPEKTALTFEKLEGAKLQGPAKFVQGTPITTYDDAFGMDLTYYEGSATIQQKLTLTGGDYAVEGYVSFMSCCDGMCTPPTNYDFVLNGTFEAPKAKEEPKAEEPKVEEAPKAEEPAVVAETPEAESEAAPAETPAAEMAEGDLWTPVIDKLQAFADGTAEESNETHSWWYILIAGFIAGILALITPCVWPMIPMTVSFFLKRSKNDRKKSITDAVTYGLSIVVIYVALGLFITVAFGASALNSLATNAIFNIVFFLLLVVFALSFFGAFELTLPESWTTKLDEKADNLQMDARRAAKAGDTSLKAKMASLFSIFFMAFTLCLVSFSCTGPIIGTLLVEAATSGSMLYPSIGMFGFAVALALPFTLFAMFPSMLNSMPKSGGWLNMVKVVLGFCELALALKFLSVADLAYGWGILDREVFLSLWIVIFLFLGLYLLGFIRLPHDDDPQPSDRVSVTRLMMALVSISFAIYLVPGLWGAPCKAVSAFAPPMNTQDFSLYDDEVKPASHDYDEAMAMAKRTGKPVMIDFSGFGCVNCRKMEASVWTDPQVKSILEKDYILVELMVDDKTPLPGGPQVIEENGKQVKLRTIGDKWSYLQRYKFGANAQPFYVLVDQNGNPLTGSYSYNEDVPAYVEFLQRGLKNYK